MNRATAIAAFEATLVAPAQAYSEQLSAANPFNASFIAGTDLMNITKARISRRNSTLILWIACSMSFNAKRNVVANVAGFGQLQASYLESGEWLKLGARLAFEVCETITIDAFRNGDRATRALASASKAARMADLYDPYLRLLCQVCGRRSGEPSKSRGTYRHRPHHARLRTSSI